MTITESAAVSRIRRALAKQGQTLRTARSVRTVQDLGRHFVVDTNTNVVVDQQVDLTELGRELRVLTPSETVEVA